VRIITAEEAYFPDVNALSDVDFRLMKDEGSIK
jgi:hypothetical protein